MTPEEATQHLFEAVKNNRLEWAQAAIEAGADVNARDNEGRTPLDWAAARGHADVARLLMESGADLGKAFEAAARKPATHAGRVKRGRDDDCQERSR